MSKIQNILNELKIDETYTKPVKQPKVYTHVKDVITLRRGLNYQADLLFLPTTKNGFKYLFVIVDIASRDFDIEPLKQKDASDVRDAFKRVLKRKYIVPPSVGSYLGTDSGSEFKGEFSKFLQENGIFHKVGVAGRHSQQSVVEALNKQLGRILNGYMNMQETRTKRTYRNWDDIVDKTRSLLNKANKISDKQLRTMEFSKPLFFPTKQTKKGFVLNKPTFNKGDEVYYLLDSPTDVLGRKQADNRFRVGDRRWSFEPLKITDVIMYDGNHMYRYLLQGRPNVSYTESQLKLHKKTDKNEEEQEQTYIVEKLLSKFKKNGITYYRVKWKGYSLKETTNEPEDKLREDGLGEMIDRFNNKK